jgi:hypothetical protein
MKLVDLQKTLFKSISGDDDSIKKSLATPYPDLAISLYKGNYFHNLKVSLSNMYPSLEGLMSYDEFHNLCIEYISSTPSRNGNLDVYGFDLPDFLRKKKMIDMYDLSRLDLAAHMAYIAPDYKVRSIADFQNIDKNHYKKLRFTINPSVKALVLSFDVLPIWNNPKNNKEISQKESYVLIYRDLNLDIRAISLINKYEYDFVISVMSNKSFYQIFAILGEEGGDEGFVSTLNKLIVNHLVVDFSY